MSDDPNVRNCAEAAAKAALSGDCECKTMGVAFFDLSRFSAWSSSEQDVQVAAFLQEFYVLSASVVEAAGGRIVKFLGDAGMAVFEPGDADEVIAALCDLTGQARELAAEHGLDAWLNVCIHAGPVVAGSFGPAGDERFDVIGKTVNVAARLRRRGVRLSAQAFRCLSAAGRKQFDKVSPPITYSFRPQGR